jgi:hypothetical protein
MTALVAPQRSASLLLPRPSPVPLVRTRPALTPLADHLALELGKHRAHAEHGAAAWCRGVETLLVDVQIAANRLQFLDEANKWPRRSYTSGPFQIIWSVTSADHPILSAANHRI